MTDFTTILKRGQRRYIDKYLKKRKFGRCEGCEQHALLIEYSDVEQSNAALLLCEYCYTAVINDDYFK
jgi:hypothetical protein